MYDRNGEMSSRRMATPGWAALHPPPCSSLIPPRKRGSRAGAPSVALDPRFRGGIKESVARPLRSTGLTRRSRMRPMDSQTKDKIVKSDAEWRQQLTPGQYKVARRHGTERAFSGAYWDNHKPGLYRCVCCGEPVFDAQTKFDSGTGWPSFYQPTAA